MTWLPPGQIETRRFPIVGERAPSRDLLEDPPSWRMGIGGLVKRPMRFDLGEFVAMAARDLVFDIHCVTSWTRFGSRFTGIPLADLLELTGVSPDAGFASFESYSSRGHTTSLPLAVALADSWVVHSFEGEPLSIEHGGPVRVVTPGRYFYKSVKWLKGVVLLEDDRLGWWEENSSYHNNADPISGTERFTTGSLRPEQLERFLGAGSYDKYRGRVLLGLDLRGWSPVTGDLRRLHLKNCDMRGVDLSGLDLRESNLSLTDLSGANLTGADLSGADLEGVDFSGADLSRANLSHTALSATRFASSSGVATVSGLLVDGAWGLLESQEEFLREEGVDIRPGGR
jgi:DMSO/TMAO reductase YedYZ molybdopterin-dependent catalytic subunit